MEKQLKIRLNGVLKNVQAIEKQGFNYVRLQDLRDAQIEVGYDEIAHIPFLSVQAE